MVQFGIWEVDINFGLIGRPLNLPEFYLETHKLWEIQESTLGPVWRWPIYYAHYGWFTPKVAHDFNKAFFYAQTYFENQRPFEVENSFNFDARTVQQQTEILGDYLYGTDEEMIAEA